METKKFVAYYRVSTQKQGQSGLGLAAQQTDVERHIKNSQGELVASFTEIESGKKDNRPEVLKALALCKELGATLVIAKLDRLSRKASFVFLLKDSGADFVCCDMPEANTLTIGLMAVIAQNERETISARVKAALTEKRKLVGEWRKGGFSKEAIEKGLRVRELNAQANENTKRAKAIVAFYRKDGLSYRAIADKLNAIGFKTAKGKDFAAMQVKRLLD